jgi:hypothetical protein
MEPYIYECENCLSREICNEIICLLKKEFCNKMILNFNYITHSDNLIRTNEIVDIIYDIITKHVDLYANNIQIPDINNIIHKPVNPKTIFKTCFQINKITNDASLDTKLTYDNFIIDNCFTNKLTFILYLNDIFDGGETAFINGINITPKSGKLLIFPTYWNYAYKENNLLRKIDEKYIIKGFLYENKYYIK